MINADDGFVTGRYLNNPLHTTRDLARYASQRLLTHLQAHTSPPQEPVSRSFAGAVLFADMQNFTVLAERLNREDPVGGVTRLASYLDLYIGRLVDIITERGGDIVKFAGDAVFAVWENERGMSEALLAAVSCGLQIQSQLHQYEVAPGTVLALRVGVSAGNMHELHLGGHRKRWEFLIAGTPMTEAGKAGTLAEPGQVILSPRAAHVLEASGDGRRMLGHCLRMRAIDTSHLPPPLVRSEIPADAHEAFNVYVPRALLVDNGNVRAELRPVTVLFCKVRGFSFSAETSLPAVQVIMLIMQECVYRYEGSINRFGVDEKGAILLAAFGLPPLAHDDDPLRGILAAIDIRNALQAIGHDASVGVATGRAFCGTVGNQTRCEYTMHGVNVNLAARLMVKADTILCDEKTFTAAQSRFNFEEQPRMSMKTLQSVRVFKPVSEFSEAIPEAHASSFPGAAPESAPDSPSQENQSF